MHSECVAPLDRDGPRLMVQPLGLRSPLADPAIAWVAIRFARIEPAEAGPTADEAGRSALHLAVPPQLSGAAPRRLTTFLAGRYCAHRALERGGHPPPIPSVGRADSGAPIWPAGWVGSISHTDGESVAICSKSTVVSLLGVDCERIVSRRTADEVGPSVAPEVARAEVDLGGLDYLIGLTLAFAAKEALYKALFTRVGRYFGFEEARVAAFRPDDEMVELVLVSDLSAEFTEGRRFELPYVVGEEVVVTALAIAAAEM